MFSKNHCIFGLNYILIKNEKRNSINHFRNIINIIKQQLSFVLRIIDDMTWKITACGRKYDNLNQNVRSKCYNKCVGSNRRKQRWVQLIANLDYIWKLQQKQSQQHWSWLAGMLNKGNLERKVLERIEMKMGKKMVELQKGIEKKALEWIIFIKMKIIFELFLETCKSKYKQFKRKNDLPRKPNSPSWSLLIIIIILYLIQVKFLFFYQNSN